ncbi:MAG: hypothetical protein BroJett030_26930 [Alphaproteobacteria bacterium]|nr:MAG: hypothetical protein BroJett030_26930 [Alphaproteobacteria bacterium]
MTVLLAFATVLTATILWHEPAAADDRACLSQDQRRAAIQGRKAVPLGRAIRAAKARQAGDVLDARLCRQDKRLVYVLTVLARDGKVVHLRVDAGSGAFIEN